MKLTDIINLNEVIVGGDQPQSIPRDKLKDRTRVGQTENLLIFKSDCQGDTVYDLDGYAYIYGRIVKNSITDDSTRSVFVIAKTETLPEHQQRGYATALYHALVTELNHIVVSDGQVSKNALRIWQSMVPRYNVFSVNRANGNIVAIKDEDSFNAAINNDPNVRLVAENVNTDHFAIPDLTESYRENGLTDQLYFTHPYSTGRWD